MIAAVACLFGPGPAEPADARSRGRTNASVPLRPKQFVWFAPRSQSGEIEIIVSLPLQRAYVYRGDTLIGISTVSTGRRGYETPAGTFNILQKRRAHRSNRYDNAPMPYMQRLTWYGIALHGGAIPAGPASHGCVRLPIAFARQLFGMTELGGRVHITDRAPSPRQARRMLS